MTPLDPSAREADYYFPCRHGWTVTKALDYEHSSGARIEREQIDGDDPLHYICQFWAVRADGDRVGPFAKFWQAIGAAVPRVKMGQLEIEFPGRAA